MLLYIQEIAHDVLLAAVAAAVFFFVVWTLSEVLGLARIGHRPFDHPAAPLPGRESAPEPDRAVAAGTRR
jgi:hypothetical protein